MKFKTNEYFLSIHIACRDRSFEECKKTRSYPQDLFFCLEKESILIFYLTLVIKLIF